MNHYLALFLIKICLRQCDSGIVQLKFSLRGVSPAASFMRFGETAAEARCDVVLFTYGWFNEESSACTSLQNVKRKNASHINIRCSV